MNEQTMIYFAHVTLQAIHRLIEEHGGEEQTYKWMQEQLNKRKEINQ